jgi:hypothetical protein
MHKTRSIIHVTVGDNNWDPTPEQIEAIRSEFAGAVSETGIDEECSVAVTRKGVVSHLLSPTITASDCDEAEVAKYGNWPFTVNVCVISLSLAAVLIAIILK